MNFRLTGSHLRWIARERNIRCADEREIILVRDDEHDPSVSRLQGKCLRSLVETRDYDVTPLDQPERTAPITTGRTEDVLHPGTCGINQPGRTNGPPPAGVGHHV